MDVITTSLEALIQRAANPQNTELDTAAINAFCLIVGKESDGVQIASRLIATHMQSTNENESLQALILLDTCMKRCGRTFHAEVGKFRFLNEMIKLVSPKYLGNTTPKAVREKVVELLHTWIEDYPREVKINEAYQMLKKQGVIKNESLPKMDDKNDIAKARGARNALFEDEETAKLLQELLQSKDPFELQLANRLIKSMVKDDERRVEQTSQKNIELESVRNSIKLLCEMLDSYNVSQTNAEDVELIRELYQTCESFKPTLLRLADEMQNNEDILGQVLTVNDELSRVFEEYTFKMSLAEPLPNSCNSSVENNSLLDFSCPAETNSSAGINLNNGQSRSTNSRSNMSPQSDMEILNDIFNCMATPASGTMTTFDSNILLPKIEIMQPIKVIEKKQAVLPMEMERKARAFQDLNDIGETLVQQSLSSSGIVKDHLIHSNMQVSHSRDVSSVAAAAATLSEQWTMAINSNRCVLKNEDEVECNKKNNIDGTIEKMMTTLKIDDEFLEMTNNGTASNNIEAEIKPLTDIHVTVEDITPSGRLPITVINDKNLISVVLNFAEGSPRSDISVIVVTTISKNSKSLTDYLFQAAIPKMCKCRLQQPSTTKLPAYNPFLPPSAITQIMLIANPNKVDVSLKFMLSYTMDGETFTEMGEVDNLFNGVRNDENIGVGDN